VTRSSEYLVEILGTNCSKGTAVEFLAKHFGVEIDKTLGIGDQLNDLPMIERAGLGVAVQNADIALKERAKVVTPMTNEDGAIAWAIEQFGFQK
jgi:hydroxymethylpyrimidine pyrophosphatase-like HAD family hydrolase